MTHESVTVLWRLTLLGCGLRCDVAEALGRVGIRADAAIPAWRTAVANDRNPEMRVFAALALSRIDPRDQWPLYGNHQGVGS